MFSAQNGAEVDSADGRLVVSDVRKSFRTADEGILEVLRGVSFSVEPGEMVAITGASGSGKSTLLNGIGGLQGMDSGSIFVGPFNVREASAGRLARFRNERLGFIFQFHHLLPDFTAAENVAMPLLIKRVSRKKALKRAVQLLDELGMAGRQDHFEGELSGGEKQRVAIARAIIMEPALVVADEPTGNLDATLGTEVSALLLEFCHTHNSAGVIVTHSRRIASQCDRGLLLKDGQLCEY